MSSADQAETSIDLGLVAGAVLRRAVRILFVTVLLCAATYAVLLFVPRLYESTASILVEPRTNTFTRATTDVAGTMVLVDDAQVASQIELIKSRDTILQAIETAGLRDEPEFAGQGGSLLTLPGGGRSNDERLINAVNDRLLVARERDSRLLTVAFRATDPEVAARVANAVARAHVQRRAGQQIADTAEATAWLEQEIDRMRERVVEAERRVAEFRIENDLFVVGQNNTSLLDQQLSDFSTQITAAAERRNAAQSRSQLIRGLLDSGQSVSGVADVQASAVVQQLSNEIARLQGERAQRSATLLSNHPTIRALDAQIAEMNAQIAAEGRRVADALEAQARIEADHEAALRAELERLKQEAGLATRESVSLAELEREASAQRELLNAYLIRHSEAAARTESSSALPDVRIVSEAAPAVSPVSPRSSLILMAVALVSVTLQVGGVIFGELLSGRALVEKPRRGAAPEPQDSAFAIAPANGVPDEEDRLADTTLWRTFTQDTLGDPGKMDAVAAEAPAASDAVAPAWAGEKTLDLLAAEILGGRQRLVFIASLTGWRDSIAFAEELSARVIENGQSLVEIDAASGQRGIEQGLSDLTAGTADFGDVVHRGVHDRFAMVPWGQEAELDRHSDAVPTLVEALSDIYEAVIVVTGKIGLGSSLPLFSGTGGCCVLLGPEGAARDAATAEIEALGFAPVHEVGETESRAEVA